MSNAEKRKWRTTTNKLRILMRSQAERLCDDVYRLGGKGKNCERGPEAITAASDADKDIRALCGCIGELARLLGMSTTHLANLVSGGVSTAEVRRMDLLARITQQIEKGAACGDEIASGLYSLRSTLEAMRNLVRDS